MTDETNPISSRSWIRPNEATSTLWRRSVGDSDAASSGSTRPQVWSCAGQLVSPTAIGLGAQLAKSSWLPARKNRRYGRGAIELIVVAGIVGFLVLVVLMALPRGREGARLVGCQRNMMQIGIGLQMYHQMQRKFPTVPDWTATQRDGPLQAMLDAFVLPDLLELRDPSKPPKGSQSPPKSAHVNGLACPSDSNAMSGRLSPFVSYRANTGDSSEGQGGPFQPGRSMTNAELEAARGASYTAAYSERLIGDGRDRSPAAWNYANDCVIASINQWRGDAGALWSEATWRSTLYNHTLNPNSTKPSCIADDGKSALMGVSSGHINRVNLLMMDGSLRGVTSTIDPKIWSDLGTVGSSAAGPASSSPP
jgi:hypothetical protein